MKSTSSPRNTGGVQISANTPQRQRRKKPIPSETTDYRAIFNTVNDAIFIHDPETGAILDVNDKMSEMYGYTPEEMRELNVEAVSAGYSPYTQTDALCWIRRATLGKPQLFEWLARNKKGNLFWIEVNLKHAVISGKDRLLAVVRDITDRKKAEELLERERATFLAVLQKDPYGVMLMDQSATFLYINPEFTAITGYGLQDVATRQDWLHKAYPDPHYRALVEETWEKDFFKRGVNRVFRITCKSGNTKEIEFYRTLLDDGRSVITLLDITERQLAEETLRKSKEALSAIFNSVYDAIFLHDLDGTIIDVNDKMLQMYRVTRQDAIRLSILRDYSSADNPLEELPQVWKRVIAGQNQFFEWKARRPYDGTVFDAEVFLRKLHLDEKDIILATVRDITERKQVERAIRDSEERHRTLVESSSDAILTIDTSRNIVSCNQAFLDMFGYRREEVQGLSARILHQTEESFASFGELAYPTVEQAGAFRTEWNFVRKDRSIFPGETVTSAIRTPEGIHTGYVSIIRDVTARKLAEDEIKRRNLELSALNTIITSVSSSLEIGYVSQTLRTLFMEQLEIPGGSVFFYDESHNRTIADTQWGIPESMVAAFKDFALEHFDRKRDHQTFFRVDFRTIPQLTSMGLDVARPEWHSYLCVPLLAKGEIDGLACLFSKAPTVFSPDQLSFFETIGQQVGVAIQNARLFAQVRAVSEQMRMLSHRLVEVQETERRYIARELHDEIGQVLTGLKLFLEMSTRLPDEDLRSNLDEAQTIVNRLMGLVRELSLKLRPAMLDDLGLLPALLWHVERFKAQTKVKVDLRHTGIAGRFSLEVETAAYRIVQEALTNVARHAGVNEATVRIWSDGKILRVQIQDHGIGFNAFAVLRAGTSSGLAGMRERVALLGGQLTVDSVPCSGTRVTAELPLEDSPVTA